MFYGVFLVSASVSPFGNFDDYDDYPTSHSPVKIIFCLCFNPLGCSHSLEAMEAQVLHTQLPWAVLIAPKPNQLSQTKLKETQSKTQNPKENQNKKQKATNQPTKPTPPPPRHGWSPLYLSRTQRAAARRPGLRAAAGAVAL